jgi:hypothetical protein
MEAVVMVSEKALDDYEVAARARVDRLQDELDRIAQELSVARDALSHVEITRATLAAIAAFRPAVTTVAAAAGELSAPAGVVAVDRSERVPVWNPGLTGDVLPAHYQPLFELLVGAEAPVRCQQLAGGLGFDLVPKKIEGIRSKLKQLVDRGWAVEQAPGLFAVRN